MAPGSRNLLLTRFTPGRSSRLVLGMTAQHAFIAEATVTGWGMGVGYSLEYSSDTGALILGTGLAIVLVIWRRSGQTLDVENLATLKGALLFWIAVVFSNSLGTSTGD